MPSLLLLRRAFGWRWPFYVKKNVTKGKSRRTFLDAERAGDKEGKRLDFELYEYARSYLTTLSRGGETRLLKNVSFPRSNRASARPVPRFARLHRRIVSSRKFTSTRRTN